MGTLDVAIADMLGQNEGEDKELEQLSRAVAQSQWTSIVGNLKRTAPPVNSSTPQSTPNSEGFLELPTKVNPGRVPIRENRSLIFVDPLSHTDLMTGQFMRGSEGYAGVSLTPKGTPSKFDTPQKLGQFEQIQRNAQYLTQVRDKELAEALQSSPSGDLGLDTLKSALKDSSKGNEQTSHTHSQNVTKTAAAVSKITRDEQLKKQFRDLSNENFDMRDGSNLDAMWEQSIQTALAEQDKFTKKYGSGNMVAFVQAFTGVDVTPMMRAGLDNALKKAEILGNAVQIRSQTSKNLVDLIDKIRTDETVNDVRAASSPNGDKKHLQETRENVLAAIVTASNRGDLPGWDINEENASTLVDSFITYLNTGGNSEDPVWGQSGGVVLSALKGINPVRRANPTSLATDWSKLIATTSPGGITNRDALVAMEKTYSDYTRQMEEAGVKQAEIDTFKQQFNSSVPEERAAALKALDTFAYNQQNDLYTKGLNSQIVKGAIPMQSPNITYSRLMQEGKIEPDAMLGNIIQSRQVSDSREIPDYMGSVLERTRLAVQGGGEQEPTQEEKEELASRYAETLSILGRDLIQSANMPELLPPYLNLDGDSLLLQIKGGGAFGYDRQIPMDFTNKTALKHFLLQSTAF